MGIAKRSAKILFVPVEQLPHGALNIDLICQVHAAAQIQAQLQRTQTQVAHPFRNARSLRQGDGELIGACLGDHVARLQLVLFTAETQGQASLIEKRAGRRDTLVLQNLFDRRAIAVLHGGSIADQLQGIFLAEQIGNRQQNSDQKHDRDQRDLPARVRDHALLTVPLGKTCATWNFCSFTLTPAAISRVRNWSPTSVTLPRMPPVVATSSPSPILESISRCSLARLFCGRMSKK